MKKTPQPPVFPKSVVAPVSDFLKQQLHKLTRRQKEIQSDDPFNDLTVIPDTIAPDAEAAEQVGHWRSAALQREISRKIIQTKRALTRIKVGKYGICVKCGNMIDTDRLMIYPEATLCINCGKKKERNARPRSSS